MKNTIMLFFIYFMLSNVIFVNAKEETRSFDNDIYSIPDELIQFFNDAGNQKAICPELLEAIAFYESRFYPEVKNKNCIGIMQIDVVIQKARIKKLGFEEKDMFDPEKNIIVAADILAELYEKYGDDNPYVIMYYAGEKKALSEYKNSGKSSDLANKILNLSEKYERIHNK